MVKKYSAEFWELDSLADSTQYDQIGHCVALLEHQLESFDERKKTEHSASFETLIQASFLTATVAQMEHNLKKICDVIAEKRNLAIRTTDMKGANGFQSCIAYLGKVLQVPLPEMDLKVIRAVVDLRNCWVHNGGYLAKIPGDLGDLAEHVEMASDGQIKIATPFVQHVCRRCQSFEGVVVRAINAGYAQLEEASRLNKRT
jgi:hypothetical protein